MNTTPKVLCRIVSAIGFACSAFSLWYIATVSIIIFGSSPDADTPPLFTEWYAGLSFAAAIIAIGAAIGSFNLARLRISGARLLTTASCLPLPLMLIVGMSWLSPMGMSIAAASGVSLGGLMPMMFSLLPVWAGLLWLFAFRPSQQPTLTIP